MEEISDATDGLDSKHLAESSDNGISQPHAEAAGATSNDGPQPELAIPPSETHEAGGSVDDNSKDENIVAVTSWPRDRGDSPNYQFEKVTSVPRRQSAGSDVIIESFDQPRAEGVRQPDQLPETSTSRSPTWEPARDREPSLNSSEDSVEITHTIRPRPHFSEQERFGPHDSGQDPSTSQDSEGPRIIEVHPHRSPRVIYPRPKDSKSLIPHAAARRPVFYPSPPTPPSPPPPRHLSPPPSPPLRHPWPGRHRTVDDGPTSRSSTDWDYPSRRRSRWRSPSPSNFLPRSRTWRTEESGRGRRGDSLDSVVRVRRYSPSPPGFRPPLRSWTPSSSDDDSSGRVRFSSRRRSRRRYSPSPPGFRPSLRTGSPEPRGHGRAGLSGYLARNRTRTTVWGAHDDLQRPFGRIHYAARTSSDRPRSRSPRRPYLMIDTEDDSDVVYSDSDVKNDISEDDAMMWKQPITTGPLVSRDHISFTTELLVAHDIEYRVYKTDDHDIVLVCPPPTPPSSIPGNGGQPEPKLRWLHVQQHSPPGRSAVFAMETIARVAVKCPFLTVKERTNVAEFFSKIISGLRKDAEDFHLDCFDFAFDETSSGRRHYPTLRLQTFFFYSSVMTFIPYTTPVQFANARIQSREDELNQVSRKLGRPHSDMILKRGLIWFCTLSPGVLITFGGLPMEHIKDTVLSISERIGKDFYIVQVWSAEDATHTKIVIDPECNYATFFRLAVSAFTSDIDPATLELFYQSRDSPHEPRRELQPEIWLELMESGRVESVNFYVGLSQTSRTREETRSTEMEEHGSRRTAPTSSRQRARARSMGGNLESNFPKASNTSRTEVPRTSGDLSRGHGAAHNLPPIIVAEHQKPNTKSSECVVDGVVESDPRANDKGKEKEKNTGDKDTDSGSTISVTPGYDEIPSNQDIEPRQSNKELENDRETGGFAEKEATNQPHFPDPNKFEDSLLRDESRPRARPLDKVNPRVTGSEKAAKPKAVSVPFLAWRPKGYKLPKNHEHTIESEILFSRLSKINTTLSSNPSRFPKVYIRAYECTRDELLGRHPFLNGHKVTNSPTASNNSSAEGIPGKENQTTTSKETTFPPQPGDNGEVQGLDKSLQEDNQPMTSNSVIMTSKHLFEVSQSIFSQFLPDNTQTLSHPVCQRFWGAVDDIIRQLCWAWSRTNPSWTIREDAAFPRLGKPNSKQPYSKCSSCLKRQGYPSVLLALEHLHDVHLDCPLDEKGEATTIHYLADDPCFAYLDISLTSDTSSPSPTFDEVLEATTRILHNLEQFDESLRKLHRLVAKTTRAVGMTQQAHPVGRGIRGTRAGSSPQPPQLPKSLVGAFEDLVSYLVVAPRCLAMRHRISATSQEDASTVEAERRKTRCLMWRMLTEQFLFENLRQAELDIWKLPATASEDGDLSTPLGVWSIDALSFERILGGAILLNSFLNTGEWILGPISKNKSHPEPYIPPARNVYYMYSEDLRAEAIRRPRRRLFLDIAGLLDEAKLIWKTLREALIRVERSLDDVESILQHVDVSPESTVSLRGEYEGLVMHRVKLKSHLKDIESVIKTAKSTQERIKQMLEVMEEESSKLLRVFTLVTVFFVPMTFVSGFFGMNTNDIRDIDANQTIYWMISIPVTFLTLLAAYMYGYKGDRISDWFRNKYLDWIVGTYHRAVPPRYRYRWMRIRQRLRKKDDRRYSHFLLPSSNSLPMTEQGDDDQKSTSSLVKEKNRQMARFWEITKLSSARDRLRRRKGNGKVKVAETFYGTLE